MMGVTAAQIVDVQRDQRVVDEALEKFPKQIDIEVADTGAGQFNRILQTRPPRTVERHPRQGFIQRHIGMTVTANPAFIAQRLLDCLAQGNADVLDGMMGVDMQIALGFDLKINQAMSGDLIEHVVEKRQATSKFGVSSTVQIDLNLNPGFQGIALDCCDACRHAILLYPTVTKKAFYLFCG